MLWIGEHTRPNGTVAEDHFVAVIFESDRTIVFDGDSWRRARQLRDVEGAARSLWFCVTPTVLSEQTQRVTNNRAAALQRYMSRLMGHAPYPTAASAPASTSSSTLSPERQHQVLQNKAAASRKGTWAPTAPHCWSAGSTRLFLNRRLSLKHPVATRVSFL